ncbi:nitroreductase family protein [Coralliovum pocilloporae]|uniref:nitroreductase family protein n=1 Tax=Coralliovum pocilloporae TaxID=3066369 RepID=UPI003306ED7B
MDQLRDYLLSRRTVPANFLTGPGPDDEQIETLLTIAARVPDHGKLAPWRFVLYDPEDADMIGTWLAECWRDREPDASEERLKQEKDRFSRAPRVIGVISCVNADHKVPVWEQELSAGAVCMNMLHGARALGYSAQWLTEWYAFDPVAARFLGCEDHERFAGFIHIGTPDQAPVERPRPNLEDITTSWKG